MGVIWVTRSVNGVISLTYHWYLGPGLWDIGPKRHFELLKVRITTIILWTNPGGFSSWFQSHHHWFSKVTTIEWHLFMFNRRIILPVGFSWKWCTHKSDGSSLSLLKSPCRGRSHFQPMWSWSYNFPHSPTWPGCFVHCRHGQSGGMDFCLRVFDAGMGLWSIRYDVSLINPQIHGVQY